MVLYGVGGFIFTYLRHQNVLWCHCVRKMNLITVQVHCCLLYLLPCQCQKKFLKCIHRHYLCTHTSLIYSIFSLQSVTCWKSRNVEYSLHAFTNILEIVNMWHAVIQQYKDLKIDILRFSYIMI